MSKACIKNPGPLEVLKLQMVVFVGYISRFFFEKMLEEQLPPYDLFCFCVPFAWCLPGKATIVSTSHDLDLAKWQTSLISESLGRPKSTVQTGAMLCCRWALHKKTLLKKRSNRVKHLGCLFYPFLLLLQAPLMYLQNATWRRASPLVQPRRPTDDAINIGIVHAGASNHVVHAPGESLQRAEWSSLIPPLIFNRRFWVKNTGYLKNPIGRRKNRPTAVASRGFLIAIWLYVAML